jgi:hypothetical protein
VVVVVGVGPKCKFVWKQARDPKKRVLVPGTPNSRIKSDLSWGSGSLTGSQGQGGEGVHPTGLARGECQRSLHNAGKPPATPQ